MWNRYRKWIGNIIYPFFLCLFVSLHALGQSTWVFDNQDIQTYKLLLSLKTNSNLINLDLDRASSQYLLHFRNSIELLTSDNEERLDTYEKETEKILDYYKDQPDDSPYHKFYVAEVLLQSAFVHLKLGHEFTAGWELRHAYREINRNIKAYPNFIPQYKTKGLLHVIIGSVPEKYNWLLTLMGMEGSVKEGVTELDKLAKSNSIFSIEAELLTLLMQGYILQETDASVEGLRQLHEESRDNLLVGYLYVSVLMKSQKNDDVIATLKSLAAQLNSDHIKFPLLKYLLGEAYLQKGEYQLAIAQYRSFRKSLQGENYLKDALYKEGLSYWLMHKADSSMKYYDMARKNGVNLTEADKHASKQLTSKTTLHKKIMEVRLLTDGGYYETALEKLDSINILGLKTTRDKVEFNYRKARIYHQMDQLNAAIAFYKKTINNIKKNNWYFAPNAALQLGYIYQSGGNIDLAKKYFRTALSYKDHEYKNSIDNKAKFALSTMK